MNKKEEEETDKLDFLYHQKGKLTTEIEILNGKLSNINKEIVNVLNKELQEISKKDGEIEKKN